MKPIDTAMLESTITDPNFRADVCNIVSQYIPRGFISTKIENCFLTNNSILKVIFNPNDAENSILIAEIYSCGIISFSSVEFSRVKNPITLQILQLFREYVKKENQISCCNITV